MNWSRGSSKICSTSSTLHPIASKPSPPPSRGRAPPHPAWRSPASATMRDEVRAPAHRIAPRKSGTGSATAPGSRASNPDITCSSSAASRTVRASGPTCASVGVAPGGKHRHASEVSLDPEQAVKLAGRRIDPPPSVPRARTASRRRRCLRRPAARPSRRLAQIPRVARDAGQGRGAGALQPNSLVRRFADDGAIAQPYALDEGASTAAMLSAMARDPKVSRAPLTAMRSSPRAASLRADRAERRT